MHPFFHLVCIGDWDCHRAVPGASCRVRNRVGVAAGPVSGAGVAAGPVKGVGVAAGNIPGLGRASDPIPGLGGPSGCVTGLHQIKTHFHRTTQFLLKVLNCTE